MVRTNISKLAPALWECSRDETKYKLGITLEGYNNNLHLDKYTYGSQFVTTCNGNRYKSPTTRLVTIEKLLTDLSSKHVARDNYYHEVPLIQDLMSYITTTDEIPEQIAQGLINTVLLCRIGRGYDYCDGVSPSGKQYYSTFMTLLSDKYTPHFIISLNRTEVQRRLAKKICLKQALEMISEVLSNVINDRNKECLEVLRQNFQTDGTYIKTIDFRRLSAAIIKWQ
jgi:hypothetical protein